MTCQTTTWRILPWMTCRSLFCRPCRWRYRRPGRILLPHVFVGRPGFGLPVSRPDSDYPGSGHAVLGHPPGNRSVSKSRPGLSPRCAASSRMLSLVRLNSQLGGLCPYVRSFRLMSGCLSLVSSIPCLVVSIPKPPEVHSSRGPKNEPGAKPELSAETRPELSLGAKPKLSLGASSKLGARPVLLAPWKTTLRATCLHRKLMGMMRYLRNIVCENVSCRCFGWQAQIRFKCA